MLRGKIRGLAAIAVALVACSHEAARADDAPVEIRRDVAYGHKDGLALTMDVVTPKEPKPNGAGILWIQSGGWYSGWAAPEALLPACRPLTDKGFTVFIVRHGSAPKYAMPEAVEDVRRAVRFIRMEAKDLGVDPDRLGAYGGSAGGHLSLMLATASDEGDPKAKDEVLRQGDRIAAAVALFPPTDLRGWVNNPPEAIKRVPGLKPPLTFDPAKEEGCSPLLQVTPDDAPTLLIHGDKDELVPIEHSQKIQAAFEKEKVDGKLIVIEGAGHGFSPEQNKATVVPSLVKWFEDHLAASKPAN